MNYAIGSVSLKGKIVYFAKLPFGGEMHAETIEDFWKIVSAIEKQFADHAYKMKLAEIAHLFLKLTASVSDGVRRTTFDLHGTELRDAFIEDLLSDGHNVHFADFDQVEMFLTARPQPGSKI